MKVSLLMVTPKDLEYSGMKMEINMKEISRLENEMDKDCLLKIMEIFM